MSLKSGVGDTCTWCALAAMGALTLLTVTWAVILINN